MNLRVVLVDDAILFWEGVASLFTAAAVPTYST
jgi:hypothetical protein